jgi:putative membrane protein
MLYEVFEWLLTLLLSPKDADSYNGQQGDMWDAQKDMGLALLGSSAVLLTRVISGLFVKRKAGLATLPGRNS